MPSKSNASGLQKKFRSDFGGGTDYYAGIRQIADNASPLSTNVDFKGTGGVGNRQGYVQIGTVTSSRTAVYGMAEYHTSSLDYAIKASSDGSGIQIGFSTGGVWTFDTSFTFTDAVNLDMVEANSLLYTFNGIDAMKAFNGSTVAPVSNSKILKYGAYYNSRLWGVDPTALDTIWFSVTSSADFSSAGSGSITIFPGSGAQITGLRVFQDNLYVWLNGSMKGIFKIAPAPTANTFTVTMITNTIGCVSHRSIAQVENDVYFVADDGIYTLGAVAYFTNIRTTNRSARMQPLFDSLSGQSKQKIVGKYFNFKYHMFYSLFGGNNDSCLAYDIRYQAMQDWRNIASQDATTYTDVNKKNHLYFGHPSTGKVFELYSGNTDDGTAISSHWSSKSFDEGYSDTEKIYFDTTFTLGSVNGTVGLSIIFNDTQVSVQKTLTQQNPQGGFGFARFGRSRFGGNRNMVVVVQIASQPERVHAKGKKFAIQYDIASTGSWSLDVITQTFIVLPHYAFPSNLKVN